MNVCTLVDIGRPVVVYIDWSVWDDAPSTVNAADKFFSVLFWRKLYKLGRLFGLRRVILSRLWPVSAVSANDPFNSEDLIADFVGECDEHLSAAGRALLDIEAAPDIVESEQFDSLFRNFHTIKGLCGMVGLGEAESLAHQLETYLGMLRKSRTGPPPEGIAHLVEGVQLLEEVVAARRDHRPIPDGRPLISKIAHLITDPSQLAQPAVQITREADAEPLPIAKIRESLKRGRQAWRVQFTPSAALAELGVTFNTIRERLKKAGEIISAEPSVLPGGGLTFAFLVTSQAGDFAAAVQAEGVEVEMFVPSELGGAEPVATSVRLVPARLVRVDLGRLDDLVGTVGELVITRSRLDNVLNGIAGLLPSAQRRAVRETCLTMERQLRTLREGVMRVRLVPVRDAFARMRFVVRDLAREAGQEIDFGLSGEGTEIDKFVVERLADPLLHMVRNAVCHGLEPPAERVKAGKPPRGRIDLRAAAAGGTLVIEVEDNGRGIDIEQVFARARQMGLISPHAPTDPNLVLDLIGAPGFTTRDSTDRGSGRGVGMDVVRKAIEDLGGTLDLDTRLGLGTRFTARLPLSLAIVDALILAVGGETYAAPQAAVREVVIVEPGVVTILENNELLSHHGRVLPLHRLSDLFGTPRTMQPFPALVVGEGKAAIAIAADGILGLREIVVRRLDDPLVQVTGLAGATELGDGRAILILDMVGLSRYCRNRSRRSEFVE